VYPSNNDETQTPVSKTLLEAQRLDEQNELMGEAFNCVLSDSAVENDFAHDCSVDDNVKFFFKLPSRFKIPTPLGTYNPDWAVVFENDVRVYFVAETKSSTVEANRRPTENLKIKCGIEHFSLAKDVIFKDVTKLEELIS
jgi:type III restriction enzyme